MEVCETTVRPTDGAVEHPRMDLLRVVERIPWQASASGFANENTRLVQINLVVITFLKLFPTLNALNSTHF
ncbi:hypothetical protein E2650_18550 [Shewanella xiamenensis]|uniref:Uncharacterized protein n=1 Tax=Shewanella xiamenensis TaxID=332186 RepID=A0AAW6R0N2_9GAMM|nr:hypothetical protein [Shewanella xiamenensis]